MQKINSAIMMTQRIHTILSFPSVMSTRNNNKKVDNKTFNSTHSTIVNSKYLGGRVSPPLTCHLFGEKMLYNILAKVVVNILVFVSASNEALK